MTPAQTRFSLFRNAITIFGAALTTTGAVLFLAFFLLELVGMHANPYLGMLFFLVLPGALRGGPGRSCRSACGWPTGATRPD